MSYDGFLSQEWLGAAVGIAITYIIFVMGLPSLIFQTFIPESLRNIYNERFNRQWNTFFVNQLLIAIFIFFISNPAVNTSLAAYLNLKLGAGEAHWGEALLALVVFLSIIFILIQGYAHLIRNFRSSRNIAQRIAQAIANNAIRHYEHHKTIEQKDFEDLTILAKELKAGQLKNEFLEECERILEYILNAAPHRQNETLIKRLLEEAVCLTITYDGAQSNQENRRKVLDILNLVNGHHSKGKSSEKAPGKQRWGLKFKRSQSIPQEVKAEIQPSNGEYTKTRIGYHTKELGINALKNGDVNSALEAIEQLYTIDADPKELFAIGSYAVQHNVMGIAVSAFQKLRSRLYNAAQSEQKWQTKELRIFYCWAGLASLLHQKGGASRAHALQRWRHFLEECQELNMDIPAMLRTTSEHFTRLTDFDTADAVEALKNALCEPTSVA